MSAAQRSPWSGRESVFSSAPPVGVGVWWGGVPCEYGTPLARPQMVGYFRVGCHSWWCDLCGACWWGCTPLVGERFAPPLHFGAVDAQLWFVFCVTQGASVEAPLALYLYLGFCGE